MDTYEIEVDYVEAGWTGKGGALQTASTEMAEPLPPPDDEEDLVVIRSPDPPPPPSGSPTLQAAFHA